MNNNMGSFGNQNLNANGIPNQSVSSLNQSNFGGGTLPTPQPKENNKKKMVIIGIVLVLVVILGVIVGIKIFGSKDNTDNNTNNQINENQTTQVDFNGYTFIIPETINYKIDNNLLTLTVKDNRWAVSVGMLESNYTNLKKNKDVIQNNFQSKGYKVSKSDIKIYEEIEYLTYELTSSNSQNVLAAYTKLNDNTVLYLSAGSNLNKFDYEILKEITPIISSVEKN